MNSKGKLFFFCGKMAAGKSTKARQIALEQSAILLSEDQWLAGLYPEEIHDFNDYLKYSARLKPVLKAHVLELLNAGMNVVLDFPGNTRKQRVWFKEIFSENGCAHELIYIDVEDRVCLERLGKRRAEQPDRAKFDTEEMFFQVTGHFQPPVADEGFAVTVLP